MENLNNGAAKTAITVEMSKMPIPASRRTKIRYPFSELATNPDPDACFIVEGSKISNINSTARFYGKKLGVRFTARTLEGNKVGVWLSKDIQKIPSTQSNKPKVVAKSKK